MFFSPNQVAVTSWLFRLLLLLLAISTLVARSLALWKTLPSWLWVRKSSPMDLIADGK